MASPAYNGRHYLVCVQKELKELEQRLAEKRAQLTSSNNRYRLLRHQRHSLLTRIQAPSATTTPPVASPAKETPVATGAQHWEASQAGAGLHGAPAVNGTVNSTCEKAVVPTRARHRGNFFTEYDEVPRPISSFAHCAGTSPQADCARVATSFCSMHA